MRIGLISDVHANLPALNAVLEDMPSVDQLVCLGDTVGYNPYPSESLETVMENCDVVIQGNHDRRINHPVHAGNEQAVEGLKLANKVISSEQRELLEKLPEKTELHEGRFLAVHSHPEHTDRYVMPGLFHNVEKYLEDYDAIFFGHTHMQGKKEFDRGVILNPGSVGQPRDKATAAYAVFDTETMETELYRTGYDIYKVVEEINKRGLPKGTGERLTPKDKANQRRNNMRY
jgi:putative phosphoesterase